MHCSELARPRPTAPQIHYMRDGGESGEDNRRALDSTPPDTMSLLLSSRRWVDCFGRVASLRVSLLEWSV